MSVFRPHTVAGTRHGTVADATMAVAADVVVVAGVAPRIIGRPWLCYADSDTGTRDSTASLRNHKGLLDSFFYF